MSGRNGISIQEPDMFVTLETHRRGLLSDLHVCKPGIIDSFDPEKRTASVSIHFRRELQDKTIIDYPLLLDCPVFTLFGGAVHAGFPIKKGDNCLVLFADSNIDAWFGNGQQPALPPDGRKHNISDGIALVGLNSLSTPLETELEDDEGGLADDMAAVAVKGGKVSVRNQAADLKAILDTLLTALQALPSNPTTATLVAAIAAAATAAQTDVDALLY